MSAFDYGPSLSDQGFSPGDAHVATCARCGHMFCQDEFVVGDPSPVEWDDGGTPRCADTAACDAEAGEIEPGFDLDAFSVENLARCEAPNGFNHALNSWTLSDWMTATLGELGEAANVAKKLNRVRDGITGNRETADELRGKLGSEIADAFIYLDLLAQSQGLRLSEIVRRTFDAKSAQIGYVPNAGASR